MKSPILSEADSITFHQIHARVAEMSEHFASWKLQIHALMGHDTDFV
jgi:hypothetical protein